MASYQYGNDAHALKGAVKEPQCSDGAEGGRISAEVLKQIFSRLDRCEGELMNKDKDIAHLKFNLKEANEKIDKREQEILLLKDKVSICEETCKLQDKKLEAQTNEIVELKTKYKQEIGELQVKINSVQESNNEQEILRLKEKVSTCKETCKLLDKQLEAQTNEIVEASNVSLDIAQRVNYCSENNVYEWCIRQSNVQQGEYKYSKVFYCNTDNLPCQLGVCLKPGNRCEIIFKPQNATDFPNGTLISIVLDVFDYDGSFGQYENLCTKEVRYEPEVGYLLLYTMNEREHKRYIERYGMVRIKLTWGYKTKQTNK